MSMFNKNNGKMLNFQKQLEHLGKRIETLSKLNFNYLDYEDLGTEFFDAFRDLDVQQCCNRFKWKGLPPYITSQMIELMLYDRGSLAGFFNGGILYVLPYAMNKGVNAYGLPNAIQPITYNGALSGEFSSQKFGGELIANNNGGLNKNAKACILYDRISVFSQASSPLSRRLLNEKLLDFQCDILGRIKNNLRNVDKKQVFYAESEGQAEQLKKDLRGAYSTTDPFVVLVKGSTTLQKDSDRTLQGDISNETQSLFEAWQSINSIRCMMSGITNGGAFEKKERKITGELQGDQTQTELVLDSGLELRKLWLEQMKEIYPEYSDILNKITVEKNGAEIELVNQDSEGFEDDGGEEDE